MRVTSLAGMKSWLDRERLELRVNSRRRRRGSVAMTDSEALSPTPGPKSKFEAKMTDQGQK